jgi:transcriptional regulator with XRE-family HTH domain
MALQFEEIGSRLRAYRLGRNLSAAEIAEIIGVSRAAVYRLEKGELVKIETLEKLSDLLDVSLPSLLGVGVEYHTSAVAFFERMRQLEERSVQILGNFSPISFLLLSDDYLPYLHKMLYETLPDAIGEREAAQSYVDRVLDILAERRRAATMQRIPVVSIVSAQDIERFLRFGLVGRFDLPEAEARDRRMAARHEIERLAAIMRRQPIGLQIGVIEDMQPNQTFQVFERLDRTSVTLSPYRLGDQPSITGIAMVTSAPEAVGLFKQIISDQWTRAHKGESGASILEAILARTPFV